MGMGGLEKGGDQALACNENKKGHLIMSALAVNRTFWVKISGVRKGRNFYFIDTGRM